MSGDWYSDAREADGRTDEEVMAEIRLRQDATPTLRDAAQAVVKRMDVEFAYLEANPGRVVSGGVVARTFRPMADALRAALAAPAPALGGLTFAAFSATNRDRCESPDGFGHPVSGWTISDWMLAATGEFGEAANVAKKLNRIRDGIPGNTQTEAELRQALADEFADAVIYLDLAAQSQGIDLGTAVASKFNRTSERIGAPHRLALAAARAGQEGE